MKILIVNKYLYPKGGSEKSVLETTKLLKDNGHKVIYFSMKSPKNIFSGQEEYFVSNVNYEGSTWSKTDAFLKLLYSIEAKKKIESLITKESPDVAHLNNIYHQISPSIIHSLKKYNIPIVMTLHDYKMVCASYSMLYQGKVCEACQNGRYYQCFLKGCVKNSHMKSFLNTIEMYFHHNIMDIYSLVDVYISPYSNFFETKLKEMGFKNNIVHLQNFVQLDRLNPQYHWVENSIVYFGRLSREKGVLTLIKAMKYLTEIYLKIIGEGPMKNELEKTIKRENIHNVQFMGYLTGEELKNEIKKSMFVVVPSEWYEPFALTIIEAFALGKPVIGSRIGGIPERVKHGETGLLFEPGDSNDLKSKIEFMINDSDNIIKMGNNARSFVAEEFNAEKHYQRLMEIYEQTIDHK